MINKLAVGCGDNYAKAGRTGRGVAAAQVKKAVRAAAAPEERSEGGREESTSCRASRGKLCRASKG